MYTRTFECAMNMCIAHALTCVQVWHKHVYYVYAWAQICNEFVDYISTKLEYVLNTFNTFQHMLERPRTRLL